MAVVYSVAITSGIPSSGTGTVATINEFLSTPGTPNSTSVVTVQMSTTPNTSAYPLVVSPVGVSQGAALASVTGSLVFGSVSSAIPTFTSTTVNPVSMDTAGNTRVAMMPTRIGGLSVHSAILSSASSGTAIVLSTQVAQVYKVEAFNIVATPIFLHLYNLSSTPTTGSTTGIAITYVIPGNTTGAGMTTELSNGVAFGTGLGYTATSGGMYSSDATAISCSNSALVNIYYKT